LCVLERDEITYNYLINHYNLRDGLGVIDRDVYFYDTDGQYVYKVNLTTDFDKSLIEDIINMILNEIN